MYLRSRNVSSGISPTDLVPGSSAGRRVLGGLHLGKSEEGRRSRVWKKVSRGSWDCEERTGDQRLEGREVGHGGWAASPGLLNARHSACTFRVHLV